jgi:hypothetical protein
MRKVVAEVWTLCLPNQTWEYSCSHRQLFRGLQEDPRLELAGTNRSPKAVHFPWPDLINARIYYWQFALG